MQQHRVLSRVRDGGKAPQALEVQGSDIGSWHDLTTHIQYIGHDSDDDFDDVNNNNDNNNSRRSSSSGGGGGGVVSTVKTNI